MELVIRGPVNEQVGRELGITEITERAPRPSDAENEGRFSRRPSDYGGGTGGRTLHKHHESMALATSSGSSICTQ